MLVLKVYIALLLFIILRIIYMMIRHYRRVISSKDYKIAVGILYNMNYTTTINKNSNEFLFELEGFKIKVDNDIHVDDVILKLTNDNLERNGPFPDPGYNILKKIRNKAEDILTKDQRDDEEMTKKDAFISLYKR